MKHNLNDILNATLEEFEIHPMEWERDKRRRLGHIVKIKQIISLLGRESGIKFREIGHFLHIDEATIMHHERVAQGLCSIYPDYAFHINNIITKLEDYEEV
jgi:hypothetical protein